MSVPAMSVFNGVCGNSFNRHTSTIWGVCVYVGLGAMFSLSNKLKDADMSGKGWRKKES